MKPSRKPGSFIYLPLAIALALTMGVLIGLMVARFMPGQAAGLVKGYSNQGSSYPLIDEVLQHVGAHYVDTINKEKLSRQVVNEILADLDPHSVFIPEKQLKAVNEDLQGGFEGIGVEFYIVRDTITVVTPITGGPSEALGILAGDQIVEINDSLVAGTGISNADVARLLKGPKGSKVDVTIRRKGLRETLSFTITRDKIPLYSLDAAYMLDEKVGYIKLNRFSQTTYSEFSEALEELEQAGMEDLILDLRQNPGGYLDQAVRVADELLEDRRLLVYTEGKSNPRYDYKTKQPGLFEQGDLILLIDEGSASASEILAGAVQDWDRGLVMGRRSYGKGLVQQQYRLQTEGALRLTVSKYYTPSGRCIQKPFEEGAEAYYNELNARFERGEIFSEDSFEIRDTTTYYTLIEKRPVYGGGGIIPDVFVPVDSLLTQVNVVRLRSFVPQFIYGYYSSHLDMLNAFENVADFRSSFQVSSAMFDAFLAEVKQKTESDIRVAEASPEGKLLKQTMKAFLAKQKWNYKGYFQVLNDADAMVLEAMKVLQAKEPGETLVNSIAEN